MKNVKLPLKGRKQYAFQYFVLSTLLFLFATRGISQCVTSPNTIEGFVFLDANHNGVKDPGEESINNVRIQAYDAFGSLLGNVLSDVNGNYTITNLTNGKEVRLTYLHNQYNDGFVGSDNGTRVQFVTVPACSKGLGLSSSLQYCNESTRILTTCFVQGRTSLLPTEPTLVGLDYGFNLGSPAEKYAMYSETGTIWGVAWNKREKALYSSAFIKQYGDLTAHGHDAIFKTSIPEVGMPSTTLFAKLSSLGQDVGSLTTTNINDCAYGEQVGKLGLGSLEISADNNYLYTINLYNNTLVVIPTQNPTAANTRSYKIPDPGCSNGEYRAFALKVYNNMVYVGVTCTAETAKSDAASSANVFAFNPTTNSFQLIFSTPYLKGYWRDNDADQLTTMQWLTDIDFTDDGNMLLALSDRVGHRYCTVNFTNRLDDQRPDLLLVGYNSASKTWTLESNGKINGLTGSGVGNNQGPGGGEFFGMDHWMHDPAYHPEVSLGSIFVMPGTNSVVSTVFDPHINAYSGGLHRYSTRNGELLGAKELYRLNTTVAFGKATGFGDIVGACIEPPIEIGNRVWNDTNKNGLQDAGEQGLPDVRLVLYNNVCTAIGTTVTDEKGNYQFNQNNVLVNLQSGETYYVGIDPALYDSNTSLYSVNGTYYTISLLQDNDELLGNKAIENIQGCDKALIQVQSTFTNHKYDIGLNVATECGLKLRAEIVDAAPVQVGDVLTYEICLTNTGAVPLGGWVLQSALASGNILPQELNEGWTLNGSVYTKLFKESLGKGKTYCTQIKVRFEEQNWNLGFNQEFSVTQIFDNNNVPVNDLSDCSTSTEDLITTLVPEVFDLALKHELATNQIYSYGSEIKINTTVYNQGNVAAGSYTIVNYLNEEFDFDPSKNPGWKLSQDGKLLTYFVDENLFPGENKAVMLTVVLKTDASQGGIINYAEITDAVDISGNEAIDFDSAPDNDVKNDKGGIVNSVSDNMINDHGVVDEDDHDPVVIMLNLVDVALIKTTTNREVIAGQEVLFNLEVINQGSVAFKKFVLRDYIPHGIVLADDTWTLLENNIAEKEFLLENSLEPGKSLITTILLKINENMTGPKVFTNVAQVFKIFDTNQREISPLDIDSNLSLTVENEENSVMAYIGQDNYSSAPVVMLGNIEVPNPCDCKQNATDRDNGQFDIVLSFESASGETWFIQQVTGMYDVTSPAPPAAPVPFVTGPAGFILDETVGLDGISTYSLEGIHIDGLGAFIIVQNEHNIIRSYRLDQGSCRYTDLNIAGPVSICNTTISNYSVNVIAGAIYTWSVDGNVVPGTGNQINIDWSVYMLGDHVVRVEISSTSGCYAPATLDVSTGVMDAAAISCISNINVSLNEQCRFEVTPNVLIAGEFNPMSPYQVMLMDVHGNTIPGATLTKEHLGQKIMAKLIDGCGGNSCWSTILVEDKIPPVTFCRDIILPCHLLDAYVGPFETDNCGEPIENILLSERITPLDCNDDFIKYIDRDYQAKDKAGNISRVCEMRISVARPDVSLIIEPEDVSMVNGNPLICANFPLDAQGRPSTSVTGVPTLHGIPLYPTPLESCNLFVGFHDRDLGVINCTRKIAREWIVFESWCDNVTPIEFTQLIEITDTIPPVIEPIEDVTVSASYGNCMARVQLPLAKVSDECNKILRVDITYPGGFIQNQNTATVNLPSGDNEITYTVYDSCWNSSSTSFIVVVEDKTAPTVVCKGEVVVSLNFLGEAYLRPVHINDGSFDACGISHFEVRKMTDRCLSGSDKYRSSVDFCCEDVGQPVMVEMRVTDINDNSNTCMIPVTVQDKFAPQITCPDDLTLSCEMPIDMDDLTEFGVASAIDACGATVTELDPISGINQCRTGVIERIFRATDNLGFAECSQYINVINENPFTPAEIIKPLDFETDKGCTPLDLHPDNLDTLYSYPVITEDFCDNVGATFKDQIFNFVPNACFKIVRTWYVIDWCAMANDPNYEPYSFQQTIKVQNKVGPVINSSCETINVCTPKGNCNKGYVVITASATDVCTPANLLQWTYKIDLDNDGIYETVETGFGGSKTVSDSFPVGNHRIQFSFEDRCGNVTTCDKLFNIKNCDAPTAVCVERISIGLVPMDLDGDGTNDIEMACVSAISLDAGSSHPCSDDLCFSFDPIDTTIVEHCFDCFDQGSNEITLYVIDKIGGGISECVVVVEVQDNNDVDVCPDLEECIVWPGEVNVTLCAPILANVGFNKIPVINSNCDCNSVTITHVDNPQTSCGPNCITLGRVWTVTFNCYSRPISYTFTQTITAIDDTPTAAITGNNIICTGKSTTLTATGGGTYRWSTPGNPTTASITVSPTTTTTFRVTVTSANNCTAVAERTVTVNPLPTVNIQGNRTVCLNQSTTLTATGGTGYTWSNGQNTAGITVTPLTTTSYTVTVTNANGCTATSSATVTVNGLPNSTITGNSPICVGKSTTLSVPQVVGNTYAWSTGASTASITVSPASTQSYTVTVTNANTCSSTGSFNVVVNPLPTVNVTGNNSICQGSSTTLTATGGTSFIWSTGQTTNQITVTPAATTTYIVTVTNSNSCSATASRTVTVNARPDANILGDTVICVGENTTLTATGGGTYLWSTGQTTSSITVSPTQNTTYRVTVTNSNQCTDIAFVSVEVGTGALSCETRDTTVYLNSMGSVVITPQLISIGDTLGCGGEVEVEVIPGMLFCNQIGINVVTLRVINVTTQITLECTAEVTVLDTIRPTLVCPANATIGCLEFDPNAPLTVFGNATFSDNCIPGLELDETPILNLNTCNVGVITRTFVVTDNSNNSRQCVQTITIEVTNALTEGDITWPMDTVTISNCMMSGPLFTGAPAIDDQGVDCAIVSIDFEDVNLPLGGGGCIDTIIRTWTVIDSCQLLAGTNDGIFVYEQVIFIVDETAPVLSNLPPALIEITLAVAQCDTLLDLSGIIATDCDDNLIFTNNGFWATNQNSLDPSGTYDVGTYPITVSAQDACGNVEEYTFTLKVKAFRAVCSKQFLFMPDSCDFLERALNFYVFDNVCPQSGQFLASFGPNVADSTILLDCSDVAMAGVNVTIYLWDTRSGDTILWDTCRSQYFFTDPMMYCQGICAGTGGRAVLTGAISTENQAPVQDVEINVTGKAMIRTNEDGQYKVDELDRGNGYNIVPKKVAGVLEGVSTLDLVLIQRHITGLGVLNSPYKLIAADVNNDRKISTLDLVDLRKTILGVQPEFTNNDSWRMVNKKFDFLDPTNPFATQIPGSHFIESLQGNYVMDFTGVKIGDVNNSYELRGGLAEGRTSDNLYLQVADYKFENNKNIEIPVTNIADKEVYGFQFALSVQNLENIRITSDVLNMTSSNYHINNGYIFISWSDENPVILSAGQVLFTIHANTNRAAYNHESITLDNDVMNAEMYAKDLSTHKVVLHYQVSATAGKDFMVIGNAPNPWSNMTTIQFYIPNQGNVELKVRDMAGKLLMTRSGHFNKGINTIDILRSEMGNGGVLLYELKFNEAVKIGKMILIE